MTSTLDAIARTHDIPSLSLGHFPTPLEEMRRLAEEIGFAGTLLVKRDDAIPFGFGGNKVRKLGIVAADAVAAGADTLVTVGGIQSNHMRATAATAAKLGLRCVLIANGTRPERPTANALLDELLGAEVRYIASRDERAGAIQRTLEELRREGRRPYAVPLGASTPRGALGYVRAVGELLAQGPAPDVIVHATSSGGTQAGLVAGCILHALSTRVIGVSADDPAASITATVAGIVREILADLGTGAAPEDLASRIEVDDAFVGDGYGIPTPESRAAQRLAARTEALFVDHTYTAKALAALIARLRDDQLAGAGRVLFWHTGGQVGLFA